MRCSTGAQGIVGTSFPALKLHRRIRVVAEQGSHHRRAIRLSTSTSMMWGAELRGSIVVPDANVGFTPFAGLGLGGPYLQLQKSQRGLDQRF